MLINKQQQFGIEIKGLRYNCHKTKTSRLLPFLADVL
jgi:hypothetical protein